MFTIAIVLATMILPIITSLCREVFLQAPRLHEEAALALGATRWEMIRMAVFPFARPGIIAAVMLGLGRALGETMAVTMVLSGTRNITFELLTSQNPNTIAATIAQNFPEAFGLKTSQLIAAGLVLFVITLAVNMVARWIVSRRAEYSGAN
jgi:phosphate transport system permease protein